MSRKKLLVLSYWFPPSGGAGTQRMAKACKYLPRSGWDPVVLTSSGVPDRQAPYQDPSLLADVAGIEVVRLAHEHTGLARHALDAVRLRLGLDAWIDAAIPVALDLARKSGAHAVLTSLSPFAGWRLGKAVKRSLGIPWLLDLRDPWALDGWRSWRTPLHALWDLDQMKRALGAADAVIANTPEAARQYLKLGVAPDRLCVIPNGYDEGMVTGDRPRRKGTKEELFTLVHTGTLHPANMPPGFTRNGLRWRHRQIAPLGRTGHYLLQALAIVRGNSPKHAARIRLHLHGFVDPTHDSLAADLGIRDLLVSWGYSPHADVLRALASADAVFVPLHGVPSGERALVVPAKLYEALASGTPVLGALPPGDGADLVALVKGGLVVPPCDAEQLAEALITMIHRAREGKAIPGGRSGHLAPFGRERLAEQLALALDRTLRGESLANLKSPWKQVAALSRGPTHL